MRAQEKKNRKRMKLRVLLATVVLSSCCHGLPNGVPRIVKPKDFDQKQAASSYFYRTEHGPHTLFVTSNSGGSSGSSFSSLPSSVGTTTFSKPFERYSTSVDPSNGAHSYVVQHVANRKSFPEVSAPISYPEKIITESLPLHHHVSVEVNDDSHGIGEIGGSDIGTHDIGTHDAIIVDSGLESGSVEDHSPNFAYSGGDIGGGSGASFHYGGHHGDHGSHFSDGKKSEHDSGYFEKKGHKGEKSYDKAHKESEG